MLYRALGRTGKNISILGFGCMRLPVIDGRRDRIDGPLATDMLHYAIDHGVNYVDTAYPYHGVTHGAPGMSEPFVGEALRGGYREQVLLATKSPSWLVESRAHMDSLLNGQLERLQTDHIDCYLVHGLTAGSWNRLLPLGVLDFLDSALADGRIRYAGFSFHDDAPAFAPIVDAYDWAFCQIQYNYMDVAYQAGQAGLRYAAERGLGVVVMEPLRGGRLADRIPPAVQAVWETAPIPRTPVEWALRYVWDDPGVSLLLSGMSAMDHVITNVALAEEGLACSLSANERELIERAARVYRSMTKADCTGCRYCMPCPSGVDIPDVLAHLNDAGLYGDVQGEREVYLLRGVGKASNCTRCGQCEEVCPQHIEIMDMLEEAVGVLE
jgi:predicted aldo/keto reductase-like oxidoreductase